jgi:hypothetical protein
MSCLRSFIQYANTLVAEGAETLVRNGSARGGATAATNGAVKTAKAAPADAGGAKPDECTPSDGAIDATDQTVEAEVQKHISAGERDVNGITDKVFWRLHPALDGKKLAAGSKDAADWVWLRDTFVTPAVQSAPALETGAAPADGTASTDGTAPATGDIYQTQNDNLYLPGGTCNMTSLTMGLLSMTNGDDMQIKQKTAEALRRLGKPLGKIKIDGKNVDLLKVFDTPALLAKVRVEDLLTTLAELNGLDVTNAGTILKVAELTGVANSGKAGGLDKLSDPAVRQRIGEHVRNGQRVILGVQGGPGHYIYLVEMRSDGLIAHDPAGCRCQREAPFFLATTVRTSYWVQTWMNLLGTPGWPAAARRRLSHNPTVLAVVERLLEARGADGHKQAAILKEVATGAKLNMGENNFYSLDDIDHYGMDVRVEMHS